MDSLHRTIALSRLAVLSAFALCWPSSLAAGETVVEEQALASQPLIVTRERPILTIEGLNFRDSNADGVLGAYEDWRLSPEQRVIDLLARMDDAEKVGTLLHGTLPGVNGVLGRGNGYDLDALTDLVDGRKITSFITRLSVPPAEMAEESNRAQQVAERGRLGIPLTISTDPRNHFQFVLGAAEVASGATQWPETTGFAALGDTALVRRFAVIVRREYRAVGIHMALSPQLDLMTEPRWARGSNTFGSDAAVTSALGAAYVEGFQGGAAGVQRDGVLTVIKHWAGYGAQPDGFDGHNYYGRFARPGASFPLHAEAFRGAIDARAAGVMPAYPIIQDVAVNSVPVEQVGAGFSRVLIEDLLRADFGFEGFVLSDWGITRDCNERCSAPTADAPQRPQDIATSWGVADLSVAERYVLGINAGIDQFGGTEDVVPLLEGLQAGTLSRDRVDLAVARVLLPKFQLGLFENPYVDPQLANAVAADPAAHAMAARTQREAQVLLQNSGNALPVRSGSKVWVFGMDPAAVRAAGLEVADSLATADLAVIRAEAPSEMLHPNHFFGSRYDEGRLDFRPGDPAFDALQDADAAGVPVVLAIFLDRPAVLTNVQDKAEVILANFGASDAAILDVIAGRSVARGRLPFELPSSMAAVEAQDPGKPDDSADPLYPRGAGLIVE
jgi:beta-glucosidase